MQPRALDRWSEERPGAQLLFGEGAHKLGARCLRQDAQSFELGFYRLGLPGELREHLKAQPALQLVASPTNPLREHLLGSSAALQALAPREGALQQLLAAHAAHGLQPRAPIVMGILNATPDSFSDGGEPARLERALAMVSAGAGIIDVGGESTRPGSEPISAEEEIRRTAALIRALAERCSLPISIDTTKASVARAAIAAGASMVNDISAGRFDPEMLSLVAESDVDLVLMHMQKTPKDMQLSPEYRDPVDSVIEHLRERVSAGLKAGIQLRRMAIDPGIGFGKRLNDNILLMRSLGEMRSLGLPVVVGASRKSMLAALGGHPEANKRDPESLGAHCFAQLQGAEIHRVHAVQECVAALKITSALGGKECQAAHQPPIQPPLRSTE